MCEYSRAKEIGVRLVKLTTTVYNNNPAIGCDDNTPGEACSANR